MCRYGMSTYKTHFACLPCRYSAKHPPRYTADAPLPACPHCREPMVDLGRDFHAPRRTDVRQWRKVAMLVRAGIRFDSCGCTGPGPRPATVGEARRQMGMRRWQRKVRASRGALRAS